MIRAWVWRWGPAVLIMAAIFCASATPGSDLPVFGTWDFVAKKGGHMFGYAVLACAFLRALNKSRPATRARLIMAVCLAFLYAVSDEFHQRFTPGRTPSVQDVGIDTLGAALGITVWCGIRKLKNSRTSGRRLEASSR